MGQWLSGSAPYLLGILLGAALVGGALLWMYTRRLRGPPESAEVATRREAYERSRKAREAIRNETIKDLRADNAKEKARDFLDFARDFDRTHPRTPPRGRSGEGE